MSIQQAKLNYSPGIHKSGVTHFLGNYQSAEHEKEIEELQMRFCQLWARMSIKVHFLRSHLDYFPKNCRDLCEEQSERFYQDIRMMEERYQGRRNVNFLLTTADVWNRMR